VAIDFALRSAEGHLDRLIELYYLSMVPKYGHKSLGHAKSHMEGWNLTLNIYTLDPALFVDNRDIRKQICIKR
jgi:hypothetical protein